MSKTFKTMPQLLEENKRLLQDKKRLDWLATQLGPERVNWADPTWYVDEGENWPDVWRLTIDAAMEDAK